MAGFGPYYKRDLEEEIIKYLPVKEIIAIVGVRQCGKTTLMKKIAEDLSLEYKINFISFDDISVLQLFEDDIETFINIYVKPFDYLFIDEIQYSSESGKKLKYIYDHFEIKIIISGSSVPEVAVQSLKYLVGRIFTFVLYPFSFREFLNVKNKKTLPTYDLGDYKKSMTNKFNQYLREFLKYGGFPRVVIADSFDEKQTILKNIYNTYLLREIKETFQIADNLKVVKLIKLLALQIGNLINFNELSNESGIQLIKLKSIIDILESTYVISLAHPYFTNKRTELVKSPKLYFLDLGFRNACLDNFSDSFVSVGENLEQFVFSEFRKQNITLKYWRTKSQAEVDFILDKHEIIPIEVKSLLKKVKISRSFYSFLSKYNCQNAYILSESLEEDVKLNPSIIVHFLPWVKLNKINPNFTN